MLEHDLLVRIGDGHDFDPLCQQRNALARGRGSPVRRIKACGERVDDGVRRSGAQCLSTFVPTHQRNQRSRGVACHGGSYEREIVHTCVIRRLDHAQLEQRCSVRCYARTSVNY